MLQGSLVQLEVLAQLLEMAELEAVLQQLEAELRYLRELGGMSKVPRDADVLIGGTDDQD